MSTVKEKQIPSSGRKFVVVYDDLKAGRKTSWVMDRAGGDYCAEGKTAGRLFTLGLYPYALTEKGDEDSICIEVFEVDNEGVEQIEKYYGPHFIQREVCVDCGEHWLIGIMFVLEKYIGGDRIKTGEWK